MTTLAPSAEAISQEMLSAIDKAFAKADHPDTPGAALAVVRDGEVILERYYGLADREHQVAVSAETMSDIASTSKQLTAAPILLLDRRGERSLDADIQSYLPQPDFGPPITVRH